MKPANKRKVDNAATPLKAQLRMQLIDRLGGDVAVIETHGGAGVLRRACYAGARDVLSIDKDPETQGTVHADSLLVLRAIGLGAFNLFDIDARRSPWQHVWIISQRRNLEPGELIGLAITSGTSGRSTSVANFTPGWSVQMQQAIGLNRATPNKRISGARGAEAFAKRLVAAWFRSASIVGWATARSKGAGVYYFGCVLEGCRK